MKRITISCRITCLEDFHIGTGSGSIGLYDAGQLKDRYGNPLIPGSTIKGLLRDSCAMLDRAYKKLGQENTSFYNRVFIDHDNLGSLDITLQPAGNSGKTIIHYFTAINKAKRRADHNSLRSVEFGASGAEFDLQMTYYDRLGQTDMLADYLLAGLKNIKSLGGKRRRGFGAISIDNAQSHVEDVPLSETKNPGCKSLKLLLELQEDALFSSRAQTGNLLHTNDYIPGTTILGMLRSIALKMEFRNTYLDDGIAEVSFFYPLPDGCPEPLGASICPVPLSFRRKKPRFGRDPLTDSIPTWALDRKDCNSIGAMLSHNLLCDQEDDPETGKGMYDGYLCLESADNNWESAKYYRVRKIHQQRNKIDRETQSTGDSGIFIEEKVAAGTLFSGTIRFPDEESCALFIRDFHSWLEGNQCLHLGKGGKRAVIKDYAPAAETGNDGQVNSTDFTLTLLSDAVLFDANLRPVKNLTPEILAGLIGDGFNPEDFEIIRCISRNTVISGFSGNSGLRKFRDLAIRKGSCFRFCYKGTDSALLFERLANLQKSGIGFRKWEGFGAVAINHPLHAVTGKQSDPDAVLSKSYISEAEKERLGAIAATYARAEEIYRDLSEIDLKGNWKSMVGDLVVKLESSVSPKLISEQFQVKMDKAKPGFWKESDPRYRIAEKVIACFSDQDTDALSKALKILLKRKAREE